MSSDHEEDDLDLLLSLQDRVLETPPASPSPPTPDFLPDDEWPKKREPTNMSVFRNAVKDCLDYQPEPAEHTGKTNRSKGSDDVEVEKYSGLRIRNQVVTHAELRDHFSDIRFVRLPTIKNLLVGDTLSGCWATVGVLTEKGTPRTSSTGKSYCIWKFGCLDENTVSVFLFGDAYKMNSKEQVRTVFALFKCSIRKDAKGEGFSLSVYTPSQILKMGTSTDYGVCKGKRKDGMACSLVINKRRGVYCKYHRLKTSEKYSTVRTELKGGNLKTAFRAALQPEGVYLIDPLSNKKNMKRSREPVKLLCVEDLRKALSKAGKVTTNTHSQGIRFLEEVTGSNRQPSLVVVIVTSFTIIHHFENAGKVNLKSGNERSTVQNQNHNVLEKRKSPTQKADPSRVTRQRAGEYSSEQRRGKMIELEYVSSDEELLG